MRKLLRLLAGLLAVAALVVWLVLGANRGWTKHTETTFVLDEVTGIEAPVIEKKFRPGVELLALHLIGAGVLFAATLLRGSRPRETRVH